MIHQNQTSLKLSPNSSSRQSVLRRPFHQQQLLSNPEMFLYSIFEILSHCCCWCQFKVPNYTQQFVMDGHTKGIASIKFSSDGMYVASASADKTVKIWNTTDGKLEETIQGMMLIYQYFSTPILHCNFLFLGHKLGISDVCWSCDNRLIASCSDDKTLKLFDVHQVIFVLLEHCRKFIKTDILVPVNYHFIRQIFFHFTFRTSNWNRFEATTITYFVAISIPSQHCSFLDHLMRRFKKRRIIF